MTTAVTENVDKHVARSLRELVSLIKDDLRNAKEAAEHAAMPYYIAAGGKLKEAKAQLNRGEWGDWLKRNFDKSERQARLYMGFHTATQGIQNGAQAPKSLHQYRRDHEGLRQNVYPGAWDKDVKKSAKRTRVDMNRIREASLTREQERRADRTLALRLIEIGFKVLSKELHPDKGGSKDAMTRLYRVRNQLKDCISRI